MIATGPVLRPLRDKGMEIWECIESLREMREKKLYEKFEMRWNGLSETLNLEAIELRRNRFTRGTLCLETLELMRNWWRGIRSERRREEARNRLSVEQLELLRNRLSEGSTLEEHRNL